MKFRMIKAALLGLALTVLVVAISHSLNVVSAVIAFTFLGGLCGCARAIFAPQASVDSYDKLQVLHVCPPGNWNRTRRLASSLHACSVQLRFENGPQDGLEVCAFFVPGCLVYLPTAPCSAADFAGGPADLIDRRAQAAYRLDSASVSKNGWAGSPLHYRFIGFVSHPTHVRQIGERTASRCSTASAMNLMIVRLKAWMLVPISYPLQVRVVDNQRAAQSARGTLNV